MFMGIGSKWPIAGVVGVSEAQVDLRQWGEFGGSQVGKEPDGALATDFECWHSHR